VLDVKCDFDCIIYIVQDTLILTLVSIVDIQMYIIVFFLLNYHINDCVWYVFVYITHLFPVQFNNWF